MIVLSRYMYFRNRDLPGKNHGEHSPIKTCSIKRVNPRSLPEQNPANKPHGYKSHDITTVLQNTLTNVFKE